MTFAVQVEPEHPILIDKFLENAIELDVDAIADHTGQVVIGGIMEHIEQAGIHSGDSACSLPTISLPSSVLDKIRTWTVQLALALKVVGLMNIQFAVVGAHGYEPQVYILEANPRASRLNHLTGPHNFSHPSPLAPRPFLSFERDSSVIIPQMN